MSALARLQDALQDAGCRSTNGSSYTCPAHEDRSPSLSVSAGSKGAVLNCFAGCDTTDILDAIGLTASDLFDEELVTEVITTYDYTDEDGKLLFRKIRKPGKKFCQQAADGTYSLKDVPRVLYNLPMVMDAIDSGDTIYLVEGEKDADRLISMGMTATTNPEGAGKWKPEYTQLLRQASDVVIIADNDKPGFEHAELVRAELHGHWADVVVMRGAVDRDKADVSDHLDAGFGMDEMIVVENPVPFHLTSDGIRETDRFRFSSGKSLLSMPPVPPAVWGDGGDILWAQGQSLIIAGHDGTGKTTLAGNLVRALLGITSEVLGLTVAPAKKNVLYLAMDRPMQAKSNLARMFGPQDEDALGKLVFHEGPPPEDFAKNTKLLAEMCEAADADICIIDSLKDAAVPLTDDATGAGWNRSRQEALARGIQLLELHHPRKPGGEQSADKIPELADLYGSRWIAAGAGSVIILHGRPGDPVIGVHNRKPVMNVVGPWKMEVCEDGTCKLDSPPDLLHEIGMRGTSGITASEAAQFLFGTATPADVKRAKRRLEKLEQGHIFAQTGGGRGSESRWFLLENRTETGHP